MRVLATAVEYLETDLVTLFEEPTYFAKLDVQVALSNLHTKSHLFEFSCLVALAIFLRFLHLLILEFTPVDDFSYRRVCVWRDFYQIKSRFFGSLESIAATQDAKLFTRLTDNTQFICTNLPVDAN